MGYYVKKDANEKPKINLEYPSLDEAVSHCPEGYSVFNSNGKCLYTRVSQDIEYEYPCNIQTETKPEVLVKYEHDKYKYIWNELKRNIKERINALYEAPDTDNLIKHSERLIEERELMRIRMMMKSLENGEPIFKED